MAAYEARWPLGTRERLAYASLLYSGQRGGDLVKMKRPDAKADFITLTQEKTGSELTIPIHPEWRTAINAGPSLGLSLLGDSKGRPIVRRMLTALIRNAVHEAGLPPECKAQVCARNCCGVLPKRKVLEADRCNQRAQIAEGGRAIHEAADQARLAE